MPLDPAALQIIRSYQARTAALRQGVSTVVERSWTGLGSYRDADVARFVRQVVPVTQGAQASMASLTDAYLAAVDAAELGQAAKPLGIPADTVTTEALRGVSADEVYLRPGVTTWTALSEGKDLQTAVGLGLQRALSIATTDLQLAKTHTSRRVLMADKSVVGYRRVIEGRHSCAKCIVASTQRYHRADLLPCHPGCDCSVQKIRGNRDPGQVIDPDRLEGIHARVAQEFGQSEGGARGIPGAVSEYRDLLVTHEHSELGPVLGVRGQHFAGPGSI